MRILRQKQQKLFNPRRSLKIMIAEWLTARGTGEIAWQVSLLALERAVALNRVEFRRRSPIVADFSGREGDGPRRRAG